ncbi:CidA/LrgA family protein [Heyndrickxia ginsengihumi]|uniref:Holin n=1 Tax=Heyndrickxia ginsengihumi TaxID=363870 RepID=A0A0A6VJG9_9BACI|nr:CidA/LrgA family holin-like protein [Heyndrickxia ginsengihumi]KHD86759.1 holin [Heyndrickxia ginsengihumi]MBE6183740.1 CidA/LrgA family holin-like protein [Bacillus sp. (in: firmicutes)]MCM3022234.1 CidA/LrgA family holin-like protein [Heyndrickxia ginsengihumi]NEY18467.1 CidA/LrgA family holin-like protein [Heyndrickxia ginsengihumi]
MKKIALGFLQVLLLLLFTKAMNWFVYLLHLPLPGNILSMMILFVLLQTKIIKLAWIEFGANFLLAELLLFFIPSAVGVIKYKTLLLENGLEIMAVLITSLITVMIGSGWIADEILKRREVKMSDN